jgi:hypothetical protein
MCLRLARNHCVGSGFFLACCSSVFASAGVCQPPATHSQLSLAYYQHEKSLLDGSSGAITQKKHDLDLQFELNDRWTIGASHRYTVLHADSLLLQTNGHLHTVFFPVHRQSPADRGGFRLSVAPALSASSNVMKDTREYTSDALQFLAAAVWTRPLSDLLSLRYGACADHRFGDFRIYPSLVVDWRPHPDWAMELGFPATQVSYKISNALGSTLRISPDGNEWFVKDKELQKQSRLNHQAYLLELLLAWQAHERFQFAVGVGRQFRNVYEMTLQDEARVRLAGNSVNRLGAALVWRF